MLMFTLVTSCLTTSNLPWFMDLTFQVPMQYCSLQHWTLLPSPVTFTTGCCSCFGSIPSFSLKLFLHWSPVAYWAPTNLGSMTTMKTQWTVWKGKKIGHCKMNSPGQQVPNMLLEIRIFTEEEHRKEVSKLAQTQVRNSSLLLWSIPNCQWLEKNEKIPWTLEKEKFLMKIWLWYWKRKCYVAK